MKTLLSLALACALLGAAPAYSGAPDVSLASSFISSGGGAGSFSAVRAFDRMIGSDATLNGIRALRKAYGPRLADHFMSEFAYVVHDSWNVAGRMDVKLPPAPASSEDTATMKALVQAGMTPAGSFNTSYLFAHLFGEPVEHQVMKDLSAREGPDSAAQFVLMGNWFFAQIARSENA